MARVFTVDKSRTEHRCGKCGDVIATGSAYRYATPYRRAKLVRCMKASCAFRQSDLSGAHSAQLYDAIDDAESAVQSAESVEDIKSVLEDVAGVAREVAELYDEANQTWTQNGASENSEWAEKKDACESFADELDGWEPDEEIDEDEVRAEVVEETAGEEISTQRVDELVAEAVEEKLQAARDSASDALGQLSI